MSQRFRFFFGLLVVFLLGYLLNEFVISSFFVDMLEQNRISIYFVKDFFLIAQTVIFFALLILYLVKKDKTRRYGFLWCVIFLF